MGRFRYNDHRFMQKHGVLANCESCGRTAWPSTDVASKEVKRLNKKYGRRFEVVRCASWTRGIHIGLEGETQRRLDGYRDARKSRMGVKGPHGTSKLVPRKKRLTGW